MKCVYVCALSALIHETDCEILTWLPENYAVRSCFLTFYAFLTYLN